MKSLDVEVVAFPPHLTDVIQRLHEAVIRAMEASFSERERTLEKENPSESSVACRLCATVDICIC